MRRHTVLLLVVMLLPLSLMACGSGPSHPRPPIDFDDFDHPERQGQGEDEPIRSSPFTLASPGEPTYNIPIPVGVPPGSQSFNLEENEDQPLSEDQVLSAPPLDDCAAILRLSNAAISEHLEASRITLSDPEEDPRATELSRRVEELGAAFQDCLDRVEEVGGPELPTRLPLPR